MPPDRALSPTLLRWMMLGEWRARPSRVVLAIMAIAIGVALGLAVHIVNRSALDEFARAVRTVSGESDLQIHAVSPAGFPEGLYPQVARAQGVAMASPVVELAARTDTGGQFTLLGVDVLRAAAVTPSLIGRRPGADTFDSSEAVFQADALFLSQDAFQALGRPVGARVTVTAAGRSAELQIAGTLPAAASGQALGVVDIATAQWLFGQIGQLQRLDVRLQEGADRARVENELGRLLPRAAELVTAETEARRSDNLSRAYRVNLEMLAMVALLTGGFLVYSAQSLSVARRRPQFALLRVLGLKPRGMLRQVLIEGAVLGVTGAGLGILLGVGLAALALNLFGGDLGGGYFAADRPRLVFTPVAAVVIASLGLIVALAGSLLPALEASRAQAAVALKAGAGDAGDPRRAPMPWISVALLGAGALAAFGPPVGGLPLLGYLSIALMLAGGVGAMPWLARVLIRPLRRLRNPAPPVALAVARLWGAPRQAAIALCGIVASTSLMVAMAVMVTSFRGSVDEWLVQILPSDVYMRIEDATGGGIPPEVQARIAALPQLEAVDFRQEAPLRLAPDRPAVRLIARELDPATIKEVLPLVARADIPVGAVAAWVSEPMADIYRLKAGQRLTLPIGSGGTTQVWVAGIWRDYSNQFGAVALDSDDYTRITGDRLRSQAAMDLASGVRPRAVAEAIRELLPPAVARQTDFAEPRNLRAVALQIFDRSFAVTYALEAIAIVVGLTGVAATFSAQTLARRKEFGMLRHVGVLRRQIVLMLATEGALLGLVGAVAGLALGVAMSQVLIHVVNPQSFHWTMETRLPWGLFTILTLALAVTSAGAAVLAGRGAVSSAAVQAVREDW
ncbi:FtsX-like permease family protein [Phenylobacterium deserti]|uniref:ABC transporter permease n=1 Tax=Phenylobacterium deserti TaxID=1914756 RepID=A0A328AI05_9CAUL|nr:FtsX-like permease family protein [Phenylobacterium deserti]RAK52478.1 ABC transporter permease [Phenylobacterium deserti]